jgi:hypothetical protein
LDLKLKLLNEEKRTNVRIERTHNKYEYSHVKKIKNTVAVFNVQFSRLILGERVSNHVLGGTVDKDNFASCNVSTEHMDTQVNVL